MPDDCHIAKRTILEISDDLDGSSKDVKAVQFGFECVRTNVPCAALRRAGAETLPYSRIGVARPELYRWSCSVAIWWCHIALTRGFVVGEAALVVTNNSS